MLLRRKNEKIFFSFRASIFFVAGFFEPWTNFFVEIFPSSAVRRFEFVISGHQKIKWLKLYLWQSVNSNICLFVDTGWWDTKPASCTASWCCSHTKLFFRLFSSFSNRFHTNSKISRNFWKIKLFVCRAEGVQANWKKKNIF